MDRVLILCGGDGKRWANYQGVRKHMLPIRGEPLVDRTIRLVKPYDLPIVVVGHDSSDFRKEYAAWPLSFELEATGDSIRPCATFLGNEHLWVDSPHGRTFILFGDDYYTRDAIRRIFDPKLDPTVWKYAHRTNGNRITGKPYWEDFAYIIPASFAEEARAAIWRVRDKCRKGSFCYEQQPIGRAWVLEMLGIDCSRCQYVTRDWLALVGGVAGAPDHFIEINDLTDDFDSAEDYDRWIGLFGEAGPREELT